MQKASYHNEKMPELMAHMAAEFIGLESNRTSLITVTSCKLSSDNKYGTIFFTVLPDNQERAASDFLDRKRKEFKMFVREKSRIGRIPEITFVLDLGEKNRQKIDFLSNTD
jgi:ribosome-binding factor A